MKSTIVSFSRLPGVVVSVGVVLAVALQASAGVYDPPEPTDISGTTASGLQWSAVATGTALPIRTSATSSFNGQPGAVAYFNTLTGQLQVNPRGYNLNAVIITYTTGTVNVSGTTPGPFTYATGTTTNAYSPTTGTPGRIFARPDAIRCSEATSATVTRSPGRFCRTSSSERLRNRGNNSVAATSRIRSATCARLPLSGIDFSRRRRTGPLP